MMGFLSFYAQIMLLNDRELFLKPTKSMIVPHTSLKTICCTLGTYFASKCNRNFYSNNQDCRILVLTYTKQRLYAWVKIWWSASSNRRALHELRELQPWHLRMLRLHSDIKNATKDFVPWQFLHNTQNHDSCWRTFPSLPVIRSISGFQDPLR